MNTFYHLHNQHHHHQEPIIIVTATRTPCSWSLFSPRFIIYSLDLLELINVALKVPCKRTQHCWPTTPKIDGCYMLRPFAHLVACCWMLLRVVAQSLKPVKLFSQQLPTFLLFRDRRSVAQQCWIRLHSSSNIVGATHAHYAWFTKIYRLYPSHDALQVPTLLAQQCWELLRPFARSLRTNSL